MFSNLYQKIYSLPTHYKQYACVALGILIYCFFFLPPRLQPDAIKMFTHAKNFSMTDYESPFFVIFAHYLDYLYSAPYLMLFINWVFLWGSCIIGINLCQKSRWSWFFLLIPFWNSTLAHSGDVLKDTIFSFGYIFLSMYLAYHTLHRKTLTGFQTFFCFCAAFYFTTSKVQANYIVPIMMAWIVFLQPMRALWKKILLWFGLSLLMLTCIYGAKKILIDSKKGYNYNYWQYVKIYDLAGMSVMSHQVVVPSFLWKDPNNISVDSFTN